VKRLVFEYWTPLFLWLILLLMCSTDSFSAGETSKIIVAYLRFVFPGLAPDQLHFWHAVIRKTAHITSYFVLAVFTYRCLKVEQADLTQAKLVTLGLVVFAATFDEIHQEFTLFRAASPVDVGYDCLGAVLALRLVTTYETRRLRSYSIL
jgi:VanZ family protein